MAHILAWWWCMRTCAQRQNKERYKSTSGKFGKCPVQDIQVGVPCTRAHTCT